MKHSYFSNYFIICLPPIFSVVEIVCCLPKINSNYFIIIKNFKVTNTSLYLFIEIS